MDDQILKIMQPGDLGTEEIVIAKGTSHQQVLTFSYPLHLQHPEATIFRSLIEEIQMLKARVEVLEKA